jgi:hypothetical protein
MPDRLRAVCDLMVPRVRESAGLHSYDGTVPDLSPGAVRAALGRLGGEPLQDPHDEAHLRAFERMLHVAYGQVEIHRRSPQPLLSALDVSGYERDYGPRRDRVEARRRHLEAWPSAIEAGLASLDGIPAPVATGLLGSVRGLGRGLDTADPGEREALAAHARLVEHVEHAARHGDPDPALGASALALMLGAGECVEVDLAAMSRQADTERDRLRALLAEACGRLRPGVPVAAVVTDLVTDHPDAQGVLDSARALTEEVIAFTLERGLLDGIAGDCRVAPSPPSRRWATAMMSWTGPYETDGPSWYFITPPDESWHPERQREWLSAFSATTLPATTVHEVAPGHFAHGRLLRAVEEPVRRTLYSPAFIEGWAHYAEELAVEQGLRADDPRFAIGVAVKSLARVTRMAVAIGLHTGAMTVAEAVTRFTEDAFLRGPVAEAEAARATFDPTYGRYTWGKLEILRLREEARRRWGASFTLRRFHAALMDLGSPPLGLLGTALERG